jgi:RimJ/RimL family protein N-acetyltransferase
LTSITIRPFDPEEWSLFRDFRLNALKATPGVFATSYAEAATRSTQEWRSAIEGPGHQVFGLFDDDQLIGITAAVTSRDDPSGQTAMFAMSFVLSEYRHRGLSRLCYDERLAWVQARPHFRRVIVSHRASNEASRRIIVRYGFVLTGRSPRIWPNGETEDELMYELLLHQSTP